MSVVPMTEEFEKSVHLYRGREPANIRNIDKLYALKSPVAKIEAIHTGPNAKQVSDQKANNLSPVFQCSIGCDVMLTWNLWQEAGLVNGTLGKVWEILYEKGTKPPSLPVAILVQFPNFGGKSFIDGVENIVAIVPQTSKFRTRGKCTRTQFPLMLAYGLTIHKAQGSTFDKAVVDIGPQEPPTAPGLAFVAISRCRNLSDYIFKDWNGDRLNQVRKLTLYKKRVFEINNLEKYFQETRMRYVSNAVYDNTHIIDVTNLLKEINKKKPKQQTVSRSFRKSQSSKDSSVPTIWQKQKMLFEKKRKAITLADRARKRAKTVKKSATKRKASQKHPPAKRLKKSIPSKKIHPKRKLPQKTSVKKKRKTTHFNI